MTAYYNEFDPNAAAWLRELIKAGHIADGEVDTRSIEDVTPDDLRPFTQCHFFAGVGGWSLALRMAGWDDDSRPVWTGSCPCQPFSAAGKGEGFSDERHLWPAFYHLIEQCRPSSVFGEQVASRDGLDWLDLVRADLEGSRYAFGAADLCAAGFGAPHIRQRLFWVAHADNTERRAISQHRQDGRHRADSRRQEAHGIPGARCEVRGLAHSDGRDASAERQQRSGEQRQQPQDGGCGLVAPGGLADTAGGRDFAGIARADIGGLSASDGCGVEGDHPACPTNGFWRAADWLGCRDGKWRPVEPGTFPLAHGLPARVGRLRGYGNAIVPEVAATFVRAAS